MGDTLRAPNTRQNGQSAPLPLQMDAPLQPLALSQPRKFDLLDNPPKGDTKLKDAPMLESAPYASLPPQERQNSTLFLFNHGRQDLISSLLNSFPIAGAQGYPTGGPGGHRGSTFPSYYMGPRESVSGPSQPPEMAARLRGDSIFLPPPVSTNKYDGDTQPANTASSAGLNPLRSNSIFSALIQMPNSGNNSVSGQSSKEGSKLYNANRRSVSNSEFLQSYDSLNKDLNASFSWNRDKAPLPAPKQSQKSVDYYNSFWEQMNGGTSGSIAGISNDNLNAFLSSLQNNGSIDFGNMSNEQRRDSILKFINDQHSLKSSRSGPSSTQLREDIFDKLKGANLYPIQDTQLRKASATEHDHLSPTSSMSSRSSHKVREQPQLPKTSPQRTSARVIEPQMPLQNSPQYTQTGPVQKQPAAFYQNLSPNEAYSYPFQDNVGQYLPLQQPPSPQLKKPKGQFPQYSLPGVPPPQRMPNNSYPIPPHVSNQYPPVFKSQYSGPEPTDSASLYSPKGKPAGQGFESVADGKPLVPAQQYARSEDGRPLLGATKVDQLMLVIQAREKGNTGAIKQAPDGSILAAPSGNDKDGVLPLTVDLVGGVDKPQREGDADDGEKKKKRRGKTQQCPYCFKIFNQSTHLDVHVRSHIGYKPFQCKYCLKRFTQGGNLRTHMRLHTGEKPFHCEVCQRSFSRKGNLAAHMLTHKKEKPFECRLDHCDKSFTQLGNLKSHQNKFHLPTLTKLTNTFANLSGDAIEALPEDEKELLDYFAKLYKNSNRGIRGRGKGKRVAKINDNGSDQSISAPGSTQTSPEQSVLPMHTPMMDQQGHVEHMLHHDLNLGAPNYNPGTTNY